MEIIRLFSISILLSTACLVRADTVFSSTAGGVAPSPAQARAESSSQINASGASAATGRKFEKMAESEIQDFRTQLEKQPFPTILQAGIDADRLEHDERKTSDIFLVALPEAMKKRPPDQAFLEQLKAAITNKDTPEVERDSLIAALGRAQREETAAILLELAATTRSDPNMHYDVVNAIGELGQAGEKFTPLLENQWFSPDNDHDQRMLYRVARGMAEAGGLSSIELLLDAALAPDGNLPLAVWNRKSGGPR
ncbi:MAG TPA: hypothetical protein VNW30_04395 [Opitutaceae bacterium]|jgi:hypothetical protein|nr:hypothetical protein [Opitutaceae bacterium]